MRNSTKRKETRPRIRLNPEVRRQLIVAAAFKAIAEEGFEGLRTRDIAASVDINSATLHHYFATKEDLIAGIAAHLEDRLRSEKTEPSNTVSVIERQFGDVIFYARERPDILAVYREFVARAPRDPAIHALVERLHAGWRAGIVADLARGKADGALRADLDLDLATGLILSAAWGLVSQIFVSTDDLVAASRQLTAWMAA
jgi:AcrR family transcriptional regulator